MYYLDNYLCFYGLPTFLRVVSNSMLNQQSDVSLHLHHYVPFLLLCVSPTKLTSIPTLVGQNIWTGAASQQQTPERPNYIKAPLVSIQGS